MHVSLMAYLSICLLHAGVLSLSQTGETAVGLGFSPLDRPRTLIFNEVKITEKFEGDYPQRTC